MAEFHIGHNLDPDLVRLALACAREGGADRLALESGKSAATLGKGLRMLRGLGLLEGDGMPTLSPMGEGFLAVAEQSMGLFTEALHALLSSRFRTDPNARFSWAYARLVDTLWRAGDIVLDSSARADLVGEVVQAAAKAFDLPEAKVAFSGDSVRGVLTWLRPLDPMVLQSDGGDCRFHRRFFCHAPTLLWAAGSLYQESGAAWGVRLFLTPGREEQLCRQCILDPTGLDNVLLAAKRASDFDHGGVFDYGSEGGFGRWLLLARPCFPPVLPGAGG